MQTAQKCLCSSAVTRCGAALPLPCSRANADAHTGDGVMGLKYSIVLNNEGLTFLGAINKWPKIDVA